MIKEPETKTEEWKEMSLKETMVKMIVRKLKKVICVK